MIVRGTTPGFTFLIPSVYLHNEIAQGYVTFRQRDVIITKTFTDADIQRGGEFGKVEIALTQEETYRFKFYSEMYKNVILVQIKTKDVEGSIYASDIMTENVGLALYEETI